MCRRNKFLPSNDFILTSRSVRRANNITINQETHDEKTKRRPNKRSFRLIYHSKDEISKTTSLMQDTKILSLDSTDQLTT